MRKIEITLPAALAVWVEENTAQGRHTSVSDYVRSLVRRDQKMCEALVEALIEGERSGISARSAREIVESQRSQFAGHGQR